MIASVQIKTEEDTIALDQIENASGVSSIERLEELRQASLPRVEKLSAEIETQLSCSSIVNLKKNETAIAKSKRPEVLRKYPWFELRHLRDYLRFRSKLRHPQDFVKVIRFFEELQKRGEISIVKIDIGKLTEPNPFGWRMVATDIRIMETDMLVEHYMTYDHMIVSNDRWLHSVFETWRNADRDDLTMKELVLLDADSKFSFSANESMFVKGCLSDEAMFQAESPDYKRIIENVPASLQAQISQLPPLGKP